MASTNDNEIVSRASRHTILKFELIEKYVEAWAQILLNNKYCRRIVFIDCMCNSGEYIDDNQKQVFGTAIRVAKILRDVAGQYPMKQIEIVFNDINPEKIDHLKQLLPKDKNNFRISASVGDANVLLKFMGPNLDQMSNTHYLLVYDPYDAHIDWEALEPFFNSWSEVMINHSLMDSTRAVKVAKTDKAVNKYQGTYKMDIGNLSTHGSNREFYERRVEEIIRHLRKDKRKDYYIAAAPFFNTKNAIVYNLIYCTNSIKGFKLYKQVAWQTFGGQSSTKDTHGEENQFAFDISNNGSITTVTDEDCYHITDIAKYLQNEFSGQTDVPLEKLWAALDTHPIFPSDCYRTKIKSELAKIYNADVHKSTISFK